MPWARAAGLRGRSDRDRWALNPRDLGEHLFRHEYGRLVAMVSRRMGVHHLDVIEDAVQTALLAAVESWPEGRLPDNPSAWLFRASYNHAVGALRRRARRARIAEQHKDDQASSAEPARDGCSAMSNRSSCSCQR